MKIILSKPFNPEDVTISKEVDESVKKKSAVERGREEVPELDQRLVMVEKGIRNTGLADYFALRSTWSKFLLGWISALIAFNCLLTVGVGLGWLDFSKYQWFITAVLIETFLQIVGLGLVAMKFLFKDP